MIKLFRNIRQNLLAEGKTSRYLKYAIGEIFLVVIGILIALSINNWNEDQKSANQEILYLKRLLSENNQDLLTFSRNIKTLEKGNETIVNFSEALKNDTIVDAKLIHAANDYFANGSLYPVFTSSTSTFDDLSSTGNLKVITNTNLRDSIVQYYAMHQQIAEWIKIGTDWALPLDAPFTIENNVMKFEPSTAFLYPKQSEAQLAKELRENKLAYISNTAAHYWINADCISRLENVKQETYKLIQKLERELKKR